MPCYFNNMIRNYFVCDDSDVNEQINNLANSLDVRSNLLFDFIDTTIYHFGPPSYDLNTPYINKINFETWRQEIYAITTNDIDLSDMTNIDLNKCNMFWSAMEDRNLLDDYINTENIEAIFNLSPINYQRHYIDILETENAAQPHADNIEFDDEDELSDDDYLSEDEDDDDISDSDENDCDRETETETETETECEETNIITHIRNVTNNDPAAIMRIIHTLQNYAQNSNTVRV